MAILQTLLTYLTTHPSPLKTPETSQDLAQLSAPFLSSPASKSDTQETWYLYEQLLLASLRTGDDSNARILLSRLSDRFGATSPRILSLTGLYDEATAADRSALEDILKRYTALLSEDPTSTPVEKRRVALLQSLGRTDEAILALTKLLAHSPTDSEAWSHLAHLYRSQGLYAQSTFCLEEVLLVQPNAYPIHARLGETSFIAANSGNALNDFESLIDSTRHFCRAVELCEWYLRGWYGLRVATDKILSSNVKGASSMPRKTVEGLNAKATERLAEIVRRAGSEEEGWGGFDAGELEAARELVKPADVAR